MRQPGATSDITLHIPQKKTNEFLSNQIIFFLCEDFFKGTPDFFFKKIKGPRMEPVPNSGLNLNCQNLLKFAKICLVIPILALNRNLEL